MLPTIPLVSPTQRRKMIGMICKGLPVLIRQPWPAPDQTSQLGIGFTRIEPKMLRFLLRAVRCRFNLFL